MDIMKQPLHPRVWAWLELAIEAGVDGPKTMGLGRYG